MTVLTMTVMTVTKKRAAERKPAAKPRAFSKMAVIAAPAVTAAQVSGVGGQQASLPPIVNPPNHFEHKKVQATPNTTEPN